MTETNKYHHYVKVVLTFDIAGMSEANAHAYVRHIVAGYANVDALPNPPEGDPTQVVFCNVVARPLLEN